MNRYLLSVDVEDWFQVENLRSIYPINSWNNQELRIRRNIGLILEILGSRNTKGTFFILGWIAKKMPGLVKEIQAAGHEIASHGTNHESLKNLNKRAFEEDIAESKTLLEDLTGNEVIGYRAPNFSITDWAIDALIEKGFRYDSSFFDFAKHDRYGSLKQYKAENAVSRLTENFHEIRISYLQFMNSRLPWGGGGYFRLYPYQLFKLGIRKIIKSESIYCFYIHPWEFDQSQPKVNGISRFNRFRHYNNLDKTEDRFRNLISSFEFEPLKSALL